ncbi:hydrolase 2, exosortase A system-associated [Paucibacter sediminis]|uniref:Hydrolase 2, exosortase A system-associated n=1 Tax=Paucibacter sediminis TaxID=3019553 RepID=A0AA95NFV3_9BURK|nr:hydrolase 2, exosortase A system-associated [Paucibacter sp. S2-9]WIT11328.1 hydrolase 2, exosortase A system-associated [Paucibacter sp. S2-9]
MSAPHALFLDTPDGRGQRFALYHEPQGSCLGRVLYLHPFAEEMNKSRRMVALQARQFAAAGYAVLQIDLLGCGDSSGDFADASWDDWIADGLLGLQWLTARHAAAPLWLWGLRVGALLAGALSQHIAEPQRLLLWQPVLQGRMALQQFLRLKLAADLGGGAGKAVMEQLRADLDQGRAVDIAGYRLPAALASGMAGAQLAPQPNWHEVHWLELSTRDAPELLPVSDATTAAWREAGLPVLAHALHGPAFWQSTEIETAPALLDASLTALRRPQ